MLIISKTDAAVIHISIATIADAAVIFISHPHPLAGAVLRADHGGREAFIDVTVAVVVPAIANFDGGLIRHVGTDEVSLWTADPDAVGTLVGVFTVTGLTYGKTLIDLAIAVVVTLIAELIARCDCLGNRNELTIVADLIPSVTLTDTGGVLGAIIEEAVRVFIDNAVTVVVFTVADFIAGWCTGVFTAVARIAIEVHIARFTVVAATNDTFVVHTDGHFVGACHTGDAAAATVVDVGGTSRWNIIDVAIAVVVEVITDLGARNAGNSTTYSSKAAGAALLGSRSDTAAHAD